MALLLFSLNASGVQAQQTEWKFHKTSDGLHPSPIEQKMVWLMNRARANPAQEGIFLSSTGDPTLQAAIAGLGMDMNMMRAEFAAIPAAPPAAFDARIYEASRLHSLYMISIDGQTHDGQGELLYASDFYWENARLSIFSYCENAVHAHAGLNIDYGSGPGGIQAGRGHRAAIMSDLGATTPSLSNVGLAMVPENNPATEVGPYVFSAAYAEAWEEAEDHYNRFAVGTVWNDLNKNGTYDEGEGLDGVRVQLDHGGFYAVTGVSGGFAIPVTEAGRYVITYSGGNFPGTFAAVLEVDDVSVGADAEISSLPPSWEESVTPPATLPTTTVHPVIPSASLTLNPDGSLTLSWSGGTPPWQVQRSRHPGEAWEDAGSPTTATSATFPVEGTSGFFRVRSSS